MPKKHFKRAAAGVSKQMKPGSLGLTLLSIGAGYLLSDPANKELEKLIQGKPDASGAVKPISKGTATAITVGEVGLGGLLIIAHKPKPRPTLIDWGMSIGGGVIAGIGLKRGLRQMGVISGFQNVPVIGRRHKMAGYQSVPVIGSYVPSQLSGTPAQLQGYIPAGSGVRGMNGVGAYVNQGSGVVGTVMPSGSGLMNSSGYMP